MSRTFTDENLLTWEAYASSGRFGLATEPRVVFNCLTDGRRRPRFVSLQGDEADAECDVHHVSDDELRAMLQKSRELE